MRNQHYYYLICSVFGLQISIILFQKD